MIRNKIRIFLFGLVCSFIFRSRCTQDHQVHNSILFTSMYQATEYLQCRFCLYFFGANKVFSQVKCESLQTNDILILWSARNLSIGERDTL